MENEATEPRNAGPILTVAYILRLGCLVATVALLLVGGCVWHKVHWWKQRLFGEPEAVQVETVE